MEEDQELKHVCKLCTKTFHCGRSLGGHMRSHMMTMSSAEAEMKLKKKKVSSVNGGSNSNIYMGFEANGGHSGYGLRENPKKTWRLSDSRDNTLQEEKVCKECGKGFQSWKALFGHMRCHSDREKVSNSLEDDSWTVATQKVVMDSQSDNEAVAPRRKRRSRRTRYKTTTTSSSLSFVNASSSVYEIEQDQEEVAMCLMMLSRDVGNWGGSNSVTEYSDNNSVVLEARSSCLDKPITGKEDKGFVCNGDETVKMQKLRNKKLESGVSNSNNVQSEKKISEFVGSGAGFQRNGLKKVGSEVSVDGFLKDDEFKKPKQEDEARFEVSNVQFGKDSRNKNSVNCKKSSKRYSEVELQKDLIKEAGLDKDGSEFGKHNSTKRSRNDGYDPEFGGHSSKMIRYDASDSEFCKEGQKKNRYECTTCNKIFHSYQALGGHRASHKKIKGCFASKIENSENSIETEFSPDPTCDSNLIKSCSNENLIDRDGAGSAETSYGSKKNKVHECPICLKVFASGQALGGHKRSHLVGASEVRGSQTIVIQQQLPEIHENLLDLNLPAPIEENISGHAELKPWWVGSNHKHEQLVGMISN